MIIEFAFILLLLYVVIALSITGLYFRKTLFHPDLSYQPSVTLIIPARNEEAVLPKCLESVSQLEYPKDKLQVIIANDHSTDSTSDIIDAVSLTHPWIQGLEVSDPKYGLVGKTFALHEAIEQATGEIIVLSDSDCTPPKLWLRNITSYFADKRLGLVAGITHIRTKGIFSNIQAMDWAYLLGAISSIGKLDLGITAMGNNMAFRKALYDEIGGYPKIPFSVTEDFALYNAIETKTALKSRTIPSPEIINYTEPLTSFKESILQRKRWAKGTLKTPIWVRLFLLTFVFFFLAFMALIPLNPLYALLFIGIKYVTDFVYLSRVFTATRQKLSVTFPFYVLLYQVFQLAYMLILPVLLIFSPRISWKKRAY